MPETIEPRPLAWPRRVAMATLVLLAACGRNGDREAIVASGHVEATEVRIAAKVGGTLVSLPVEEGDHVQAGQTLAAIDTVDTHLALAGARAELSLVGAQLRLALAGSRPEEIATARAELEQAEADLHGADTDLERMQGLLDRGSGTTKSRDDAATRRQIAAARAEAARQQLRRLEAGSRAEDIDAARARVAAAEARVGQVAKELDDSTIESPRPGIVTQRLAESGELVGVGTPLLLLTDLGDAWLTAFVAETEVAQLRIGQEADVTTDDGQARKGRLAFISSTAEFTPKNVQTRAERVKLVFRVRIDLDNADGVFKPGMPAEARLRRAETSP